MANDEFQNFNEASVNTEFSANAEIIGAQEIEAENEIVAAEENTAEPKRSTREMDQKKKQQALSMMTGSMTAIIASAVVGITTMLNVNMSAQFNSVEYQDGNINYSVNVTDMTSDESLLIYFYDDDILEDTLTLTDDDGDGLIEGSIALDGNEIQSKLDDADNVSINYRLTLKGNVGLDVERAFDSYVVKIDKINSSFENIDYWCNCGIDGYYYFKMNFSDDFGIFKDFKAYIIDVNGKVADCTFSEDLHEAQKIYVLDLASSGTLYIEYNLKGELQVISQEVQF